MLQFSPQELNEISFLSQSFAVCNGALIRLKSSEKLQEQSPSALFVVPVPHTLKPTLIPKSVWNQANKICTVLNHLVDRMSRNRDFLAKSLAATAHGDAEFTGKLFDIFWNTPVRQEISFGLFRSDYMLHQVDNGSEIVPLQVELNTISSAFAGLSSLVQQMHQFVHALSKKC